MCKTCRRLKKELAKTATQLQELHDGDSPVDADMAKTIKAMFYERASEALEKGGS